MNYADRKTIAATSMNADNFAMLVSVVTSMVRPFKGGKAKRHIEELWSEAYTIGERNPICAEWQYLIWVTEKRGTGQYWFKRLQSSVLRKLKEQG